MTFRVASNQLQVVSPIEQLTVYHWGTNTGADYFCAKCGIMPFRKPSAPTQEELVSGAIRFEGWAINVRCLSELEFLGLPKVRIPGGDLNI